MKKERAFLGLGRNVFSTGLVSFFMDISSEMVYPLVPLFLAGVLGVNKSLIGVIEGFAESTASLLKVFSGWYSDRVGRRKGLMVLGYGISVLSRPVIATASLWHQIFAGRLIDRLGKGIRTAPRDAIIAESTEADRLARAFSFHRAMDTLGAVIGPSIAFLLLWAFSRDYRMVFWLSAVPGVLAVLVIVFFIREGGGPHTRTERPRLTPGRFSGEARCFLAIATLFALGNSSDVFLILRAEQVGVPDLAIPVVYLMFNLVYSLSALPAGMAADRFGRKRVILLGFLLFAGLYYGFGVARSALAVWVLFGLYGLFMGLTEGIQKAFLATIVPPELKATAFGIYATAVGLATLPASLIAGWLWDHVAPSAPFYFGASTAALAAILFLVMIVGKRRGGGQPALRG